MQKRSLNLPSSGKTILVSFCALLGACAYGVEPDRSSLESSSGGIGGNAGSSSSGDVVSSSSSSGAASSSSSSSSSGAASSSSSSSSSASSSSSSSGAPPTGLSVQYKASDIQPGNAEIKPHFNIVNNGATPVPLNELTIRYYYTLEPNGSQTEVFHCDYAKINCPNLNGTFKTTSGVNADHYLEIAFTGGLTLAVGDSTGEIQARYNKSDYAAYDETNDYSFDPTKTSFTTWDKVTLFHNGTLVWGMEP